MPDNRPILFAYDGSDYAKTAIREAASQLSNGRASIVLTVWQPFATLPFAGGAVIGADLEQSVEHEARKVAEEGAQLARSVGFDASARADAGDAIWRRIVDVADDVDAGVVVMGSHGRTGLSAMLLGSVAGAVAKHTPRAVLIVHDKGDD